MNNIGIENNLDRPRIKKLLAIGLAASVITGIGDFLLGYADNAADTPLAACVMSSAANLTVGQMIAGSLLGLFGIFLEGLSCFAIYRLMADASPRYAHIYRAGILGYIWLAPVGCHMNMGILNIAYKYMLSADPALAEKMAVPLFYGFGQPLYILLACFWIPMMVVQFKAFSKGLTPYPKYARWFSIVTGAIPPLIASALIGPDTALGAAVGTMFLSFGNAFMFGGLLCTLPDEERFEAFKKKLKQTGREAG